MVTIRDVARRAGVSVTTVSHVINQTRKVSDQARTAVEEAIAATGYVPNHVARSLATSSTYTLGLAVSALSNPYLGELAYAIETAAFALGYTMLLTDTSDDPDREATVLATFRGRRVDGILLATAMTGDALRNCLDALPGPAVPVVLIDRLASDGFDQVGVENERATADLVSHLAALGHRRIGLISGAPRLATTGERVTGYRRGLARNGLPYDPALEADGESDAPPARAAVHRLLDLAEPPTALVSGNNHMTVGVLRGLRDRGVRVPQDMAVVAFDDVEWADLLPTPLTAVTQPWQLIGQRAVEVLASRLAGDTAPPRTIRLDPAFVHRASCGCGPASH